MSNETVEQVTTEQVKVGQQLAPEIKQVLESNDVVENVEKEEEIVVRPNLFVSVDDFVNIDVDVIYGKKTGEIMSVVTADLELDVEKIKKVFGYMRLVFKFTYPTYDKLSRYRERATIYNNETRTNVISQLKMRDFFIIYHLKDWNVVNADGNKIELKFEPNGALSDESIDEVYRLHSSIIDVVLSMFERKMLMTG